MVPRKEQKTLQRRTCPRTAMEMEIIRRLGCDWPSSPTIPSPVRRFHAVTTVQMKKTAPRLCQSVCVRRPAVVRRQRFTDHSDLHLCSAPLTRLFSSAPTQLCTTDSNSTFACLDFPLTHAHTHTHQSQQ